MGDLTQKYKLSQANCAAPIFWIHIKNRECKSCVHGVVEGILNRSSWIHPPRRLISFQCDSLFGGISCIIAGLADRLPRIRRQNRVKRPTGSAGNFIGRGRRGSHGREEFFARLRCKLAIKATISERKKRPRD
jgi:hypothetical protein